MKNFARKHFSVVILAKMHYYCWVAIFKYKLGVIVYFGTNVAKAVVLKVPLWFLCANNETSGIFLPFKNSVIAGLGFDVGLMQLTFKGTPASTSVEVPEG